MDNPTFIVHKQLKLSLRTGEAGGTYYEIGVSPASVTATNNTLLASANITWNAAKRLLYTEIDHESYSG
jgi:TRAP-type uncharacterized transport system substrate-binding protein